MPVGAGAEGAMVDIGPIFRGRGRSRLSDGFSSLVFLSGTGVGTSSMIVWPSVPGVSFMVILDDIVRVTVVGVAALFGVAKDVLLGVGVFIPWDDVL